VRPEARISLSVGPKHLNLALRAALSRTPIFLSWLNQARTIYRRLDCPHSRQLSILASTLFDTPRRPISHFQSIQQFATAPRQCVYGERVAIPRFGTSATMFRISIADTPSRRTLIVEGTLVGPWVAELGRTWRNASQELDRRKLVIDLKNLTAIGREGEDAIFDLMKEGAKFTCGGVLIRHVLQQLVRKKRQESRRR
jgi:hypothetical protein